MFKSFSLLNLKWRVVAVFFSRDNYQSLFYKLYFPLAFIPVKSKGISFNLQWQKWSEKTTSNIF